MGRKGWTTMDVPSGWVQVIHGPKPPSQRWPQVQGSRQLGADSQNRGPGAQQRRTLSGGAKRGSTPRPPQSPAIIRERKTPEQVRSDASTKVSRLQAALSSLGDGDVEEKRALELALVKAQKQSEELPVARQIEITKEFIARAKKRILVADEKIRLAQVALQDARDEKEYDVREVPLAEARLERLLKEVVPVRQTPPVSTVSDLEAEVHRLRTQPAQMQVASVGRHPPQSSTQAAELLRERAAKRRGSVRTHPDRPSRPRLLDDRQTHGVAGRDRVWRPRVHPLFDGSHPPRGGADQKVPSMVTNVVST